MINSIKLSAGFRRTFVREVILPLLAILLLTFAGAGVGLYWGSAVTNSGAREQQQRMIEASFTQSLNEHLRQLRSLTRWTPLAEQLSATPDREWLDRNTGGWLYEMFRHPLVVLLDDSDRRVAVWRNGQSVADRHVDPALERLLQGPLVRRRAEAADARERADFVRIGQRVAALAVGEIASAAGRWRLVSITFLDDGYLRSLSERSQLRQLLFSADAPPSDRQSWYALTSRQGDRLGYVSWDADKPGGQMLHTLGPFTLLSVALITLLCLFMVRRIWTSSLSLSQSLLKLEASEAQAQHLAFHDVLTGLPNRALVDDRLTQALAAAVRHDQRVALLLDLDRFKNINDTYGHHAGDALIIEVARRLSEMVRASDTVGRLGGDEFIIVLPDAGTLDAVQALAKRIISRLSEPYLLAENELWVGVSIGLTLAPADGLDRQELMRKADIALYEAKNNGRGQYRQFEQAMDESLRSRQQMAADLRQALVNFAGLAVWYQPLMEISGQRVVGLEALLRWQHPVRGSVSPADFIAIAEETGLIIPLGEWVLREACRTAIALPQVIVAVNVSPVQFRTAGVVDRIIEIVQQEGADPQRMELEITEGVLIEDEHAARDSIVALRAAGFRIALDDFGTGYSSLNYLSSFPVDKIKIDRSFTQSLGVAQNSAAIVESVVRLGHAMGLTVTAEGVETECQKNALADAGCNQLQGYLFSQAVPLSEILKMV